jgi:hypothetical protein
VSLTSINQGVHVPTTNIAEYNTVFDNDEGLWDFEDSEDEYERELKQALDDLHRELEAVLPMVSTQLGQWLAPRVFNWICSSLGFSFHLQPA